MCAAGARRFTVVARVRRSARVRPDRPSGLAQFVERFADLHQAPHAQHRREILGRDGPPLAGRVRGECRDRLGRRVRGCVAYATPDMPTPPRAGIAWTVSESDEHTTHTTQAGMTGKHRPTGGMRPHAHEESATGQFGDTRSARQRAWDDEIEMPGSTGNRRGGNHRRSLRTRRTRGEARMHHARRRKVRLSTSAIRRSRSSTEPGPSKGCCRPNRSRSTPTERQSTDAARRQPAHTRSQRWPNRWCAHRQWAWPKAPANAPSWRSSARAPASTSRGHALGERRTRMACRKATSAGCEGCGAPARLHGVVPSVPGTLNRAPARAVRGRSRSRPRHNTPPTNRDLMCARAAIGGSGTTSSRRSRR